MAKKPWKKTELIVFVRGKPEENVLRVCKTARGKPFEFACEPPRGPGNREYPHIAKAIGKS